MSHFVCIEDVKITERDLSLLERACTNLGLDYYANEHEARFYGGSKHCHSVIKIPNCEWDIAVFQHPDNPDTYMLAGDFYSETGAVIQSTIEKLLKAYTEEVVVDWAANSGGSVVSRYVHDETGEVVLDIVHG